MAQPVEGSMSQPVEETMAQPMEETMAQPVEGIMTHPVEATMAQPVEGTISQVDEIQDKMRNQERLLAQLHDSILEQDKQLLGREAEAQSYASKLKKLQSKHLQDQEGHETGNQETPEVPEQKSQTSKPVGSLTLLRQKVEENRLKVAQRGRQEQESKRELEEKVLALKSQLEEIQKTTVSTSPLPTEQNPVDVQMVALEEQIQAKDSLIEARTRAITLLTEDFARKRKEVVDQLDETREEMRRMQENFIASEDRYRAEIQVRDKRLFDMDSKLRTLNAKLEQTEDLSIVLAEKESLQKQLDGLVAIKNEKESLKEKVKDLLNVQNLYQQKEAEVSIILGEKLKLEAELVEINRKREEESSNYLRKTQNLQKRIEKLSKQLALNESKMKDMIVIVDTCQANEEKLVSLSIEKKNLEEKVEALTSLVDSQQQIQVERGALIGSSPQQGSEMLSLLEEKQNLQQKLKSVIEYVSVPQRELKRPSVKKLDHTKKLQEVVELTKMLLVNDGKIKDFHQNLHPNNSGFMDLEPVPEKLMLEERLDQLTDLLDIYRQTIKDMCNLKEEDDINLITQRIEARNNINAADKEDLCSLTERIKQRMEKLESLTRALNESKQELQQQSVLINACKFNEAELKNELDGYQKKCSKTLQEKEQLECKVDELANLLKAIHHIRSKEMAALCEEKRDLRIKIDNLSKCVRDKKIFQFQGNTEQEQWMVELVKEKQILEEKSEELTPLFKIIGDRFDSLIECQQHQEQQLASLLEGKQEFFDVSHNHGVQESLYQLKLLQQQHSEDLLMFLQYKHQLQHKVDELWCKLVAAKEHYVQGLNDQFVASKEQYSGEMSMLQQQKQKLEAEVYELSMLVAAKEQTMQGLSDQLTASNEQYGRELSTLLQEKQQLEVKVDELSLLVAAKEQSIQGLSNQIAASKEQYSEELSTSLQEKQQLEVKVDELSMLLAAKEQSMQGLSDQLAASKEQYSKELSTLLQEKQCADIKVDELSKLVAASEQDVQRLNDQLVTIMEQYGREVYLLLEEKEQLQVKVDELKMLVADKEQHVQGLSNQLAVEKKNYNIETTTLLQEKQQLEVEVHELTMLVAANEQNMERLNDELTTNKEQHSEELSTLLQEKQELEVKIDKLSKLVTANEKSMHYSCNQLAAIKQQHKKDVECLFKECDQLQKHALELVNVIDSKTQAIEELEIEINNIQQAHKKEVTSVCEEKQTLQDAVTEYRTAISSLEQNMQQKDVEISALMLENTKLQEKVSEFSNFVSNEQNIEALNNHIKSSEQQHLEVKKQLEDELTQLSALIALNESNLQISRDQLTTTQKELSVRIQEKQWLEEKCSEYCSLLEANEQKLIALNLANAEKEEMIAHLAKQMDKQHIINEGNEKQIEEHFVQKNVALSTHVPMTGETLQEVSDRQYHQNEWAALLAERQLLQQQVQELFFYLKQNVLGLKELNVNGNEEIRTEIADSLDEKSYEQIDLQSLLAEYKANLEQLKKQMLYALTLSEEKQNLEDHLKKVQAQLYSQIEEKTDSLALVMQEKSALETRVDEVSRLLKKAEEKEEQIHQQNTILREQLNSLTKENVSNAMVIDLQNRIAELEEEKGNLQLHLVDFEELKAEGVDLTAEVESLRSQKVAAEMKGVELEEELDLLKREDNAALIDSLNIQLKIQVETCNRLSETLMERDMELNDIQKKYSCLHQQTQDQIVQLQGAVQARETALDDYKETLTHVQTSLDEVSNTNNRIKDSVEKFCFDIVHGSFGDSSQLQHMSSDSVDSLGEVKYLKSEQELFSVLSSARSILVERENFLQSLKAELSKTRDQTVSYESTLHELEFFRRENELLQAKVHDFQLMVTEKQKEVQVVTGHQESQEKMNIEDAAVQSQLKQLEQEKERLTEELKTAQVRSGKLIKKIKSLKADYDLLAAENLKLNSAVSLEPNVEQNDQIAALQHEVLKLQGELGKKVKEMDDASTQANDDQLAWLSNEYENVKHEVQHLIEEIEYKDAKSLQMVDQLQSKEATIEELAKTVESLNESLQERDHKLVHFETFSHEHNEKDDRLPSKYVESHRKELDHVLYMLRQKEEEVAHLEELLQQRVHGEPEDEPAHKELESVLKQLDDALYMLHQKEVRCDELTLELMQLLEERDTLQLRLSTTIRQCEELRASCSHTQEKCVESATSSPVLSNKLKEVRNVGREQRSMALQQRADTTVSRDNLSQSETLINWIRGRTTPKVMHI